MHLKSFIVLGLIGALAVGCSNDGKAGKSNVAPGPKTYHVPPVDPNASSAGTVPGEATTTIPSTQPSTGLNGNLYPSTFGNASDSSLDTSPETAPSTGDIVPESLGTNSLDTGLPSPGDIGSGSVNTNDLSTSDTFNTIYPSGTDIESGVDAGGFDTEFGTESNVTGNTSDEMPIYGSTTDTGYVGTDYINNNIIDGNP